MRAVIQRMLLATAMVAGVAAGASADDKKPVTIFNWGNYTSQKALDEFKAETGYEGKVAVYDSEEMMFAKVMAGSTGYDIVVTNAEPFLSNAIQAGAYLPLDKSKLPNWKNLDPSLLKIMEAADPGNKYASIYDWGTIGIGFNADMVKKRIGDMPVESWALMFDPKYASKLKDCGIAFIDSPANMYPLMLKYLGLDPNTQDKADIAKATKQFEAVRPYVKSINSANILSDLASGNTCLSVGWNGDVVTAAKRAVDAKNGQTIDFVIPKEGGIVWFDNLAIPKDTPNPEGAYALLNYMLQPKPAAYTSNEFNYGNGVPSSLSLVDPAIGKDQRIFPDDATKARVFLIKPASKAANREMTSGWTRVKVASE